MKHPALCSALFAVCLAPTAFTQSNPSIKPADYGKFETLGAGALSPDGKWVAYEVRRIDRNDELRVTAASELKPKTIAFCTNAAFSADSHWLACEATVSEAEQDKLRKSRKPVQNKMAVLELATGNVTTIDDVQSFAFSGEGAWLAFRRYAPARDNGGGSGAGAGGGGGRGAGNVGATPIEPASDRPDPTGTSLTIRNLATGADTTFGNITGIAWADTGTTLAMTIGIEGRTGNAIQVFDPKAGSLRVLDSGAALFTGLSWRKDANDLAALRSVKQDGFDGESYVVLAWKGLGEKRSAKVDAPQRLVAARAPQWSEDGNTVFVGVADWLKKPAGRKGDEDAATVEVWHWKDENVISEQKLTAARDRDRNVLAAWHLSGSRIVPLSTNNKEDVRLPKRGEHALAIDGTPYVTDSMFGRRYADLYKVDLQSGARAPVAKKVIPPVDLSPGGRYALTFQQGHFQAYDLETGATRDISKDAAGAVFTNQENDYPVPQKPPYGIAGWTTADRSVIVYDAYDLWELFPDGSGKPRRLTNGANGEIRHRYARVAAARAGAGRGGRGGGEETEWIDLAKPVYLSLEGRWTKQTGYARLADGKVERLVLQDQSVRGLEKAKSADVYLVQEGSWTVSPNFYTGGPDLKNLQRVSDTNPFAAGYAAGRAELIDYRNAQGERLQGALYYPAGYEKGKQYPMIVQIYEIESNQLHNWTAPSERATYNPAVWTQNGYFVLRPDIVFRPRNPGLSALDCVTSGVKKVLETGMIDAKKIGLVGHSWGGYETTFILTQTNLFAAGVAGGPLTNLTSSYGEIYWNSGGPETNHVEIGQERMEVPLYEDPQSYIRNSAVYFANKLAAPLLLSVGDHDGASDWHQDIELYNSARRAGKTCVMLVYEGENHSVAQKANQIDYHRRINAWFDHYLKGAPAEKWIDEGVSVLDRERELKKAEK